MRLNVRADKLLDELAKMGIELDPQIGQSYFAFLGNMGYPRSTIGIFDNATAERELNKWAKSTGQDIKFVDVNMTDYANKRAEHPEVTVDATAPVQEKITKRTSMADVIKDFYASDAPQFKGKSKAKRRQMAIAAKLSKMDEKSTASLRNQSYFDGLDRLKKLAKKANEAFESLYAQNKENALDSEVLVPGYGRMSYKGLQGHIGDKFAELGKMLKDGDASTVKKVQYLIKNDPMLAMLNSLETAFDELSAKRKQGGRGSRGIGSEFSEMKNENIIDRIKRERFAEGEERPYVCVHAKKGKHECTATSSYGAAKKAAAHWGMKSTAGIDAYLADVKHVAETGLNEDARATMPFMDVIKQYYVEDMDGNTPEDMDDARYYINGRKLVDDVRDMLEAENPNTEIIALSEGEPKMQESSKGRAESVKNIDNILVKMGADAPSDIIADIMHWIDAHPGENLQDLIRQAEGYYQDELSENIFTTGANNANTAANVATAMHSKIDAKLKNTPSIAKTKAFKDYDKGNQQRKISAMKQGMPYGRQDVGEEFDKPITKAQFQANEAENMHTENAVALARRFGTKEEHQKMLDVYEAHMDRGWIEQDEQEYRDSIIKKYYPMLEDAYSINSAILNPKGNQTCQCKYCGDKLHEPTTNCSYDSHDPNGSNWIIISAEESENDIYNSLSEAWSQEYKNSIDCSNPKGFSQKAYCDGKKKRNKG